MKLGLVAVIALLITGCSSNPPLEIVWRTRIPPDKVTEAADWIVKAVAAPAPADKDPEDRLSQATTSAQQIFGRAVVGVRTEYGYFIPYEDTSGPARALLDAYLKGGTQ